MQNVPGRNHADLLATSQPFHGSADAATTHTGGHKQSREANAFRGDTAPESTLSLSRNKFFEVAALSPLTAAGDAMDAAMLTRKSTSSGEARARGRQQRATIGRAVAMGGAWPGGELRTYATWI